MKLKRILCVLLAAVMLICLMPLQQVAAAGEISVNVTYNSSTCTAAVSWNKMSGAVRYLVSLENDNKSGTGWTQAVRTQSLSVTTNSCTFNKNDYFMKYGNGGDNYKVSVIAYDASNNKLASGKSAVFKTGLSTLSAPTLTFNSAGVATWTAVSGAAGYHYACYQGSVPVETGRQNELTMNFSHVFVSEEQYYVEVYAIGNGSTTRNSKEIKSNTITAPGKKESITGFKWSGTTLSWDAFARAYSYNLVVLKNGSQQGATLRTANNYYDFSKLFSSYGLGSYIIIVTAAIENLALSKDTYSPVYEHTSATYYTVLFQSNGHGTAPAAQTVERGKTAAKPTNPTASGWTFGGWYKEAACINAFNFTTPIMGDTFLYAKWTENAVSTFAFTKQPVSGTAKKTENYTYSWALSDTPDTVVLQAWKPIENEWANYITLSGASGSGTLGIWSGILDGNKSKYRIKATKGSTTIYSNEFTVTWTDGSSTFAFTKQPVSGTAKKTEDYTYSWALNDTPDSIVSQAWFGNSWHDGTSLKGKTSDTVSYSANITKYRIKATKGSTTIYSSEFTVTWTDGPSVLYGDLNSDGKVNTADALACLKAAVGIIKLDVNQTKAADVDGDGKVTTADALLILKYSVGIIKKFPVE
ncbi:MAG: InlB B-repeat-containing protein [Clostridia bacterium]|nr:InlB B-repeat-containing protein [Clostridia bacterium]